MNDVEQILIPRTGPHSLLKPPLDRRATRVMARARLHDELRSIALDLLGPCRPGELPVGVADWIDDATETAASMVSDTSLRALMQTLDTMVARAPREVVDRLDQAALRRDSGLY